MSALKEWIENQEFYSFHSQEWEFSDSGTPTFLDNTGHGTQESTGDEDVSKYFADTEMNHDRSCPSSPRISETGFVDFSENLASTPPGSLAPVIPPEFFHRIVNG
eukprot:TRINITY_DN6074_c0_g1_i1.p1 TRINITY_DN6074_c0_g1~~TRINITY_DN6074_c0_g1_i1.p1  ORF type:complete len:105 (+),score=22.68 TRINITY_DN6074_c0_g1_i1:74-388(+)